MDKRAAHDVLDFWEPLYDRGAMNSCSTRMNSISLFPARVHVPPLYAAEMTPFDPLVGEFRVHYAGFFDPGFGHSAAGGTGSRAVLEVRSHEVPFILEMARSSAPRL
ncbi:2'-deoxycytidine 5'-triphosphate deaminase [Brucella sp. 10RB9215]|nr:2'-deoxycytidine 5'-triphosphate deaminase [Brucella sp. 10RB9215]